MLVISSCLGTSQGCLLPMIDGASPSPKKFYCSPLHRTSRSKSVIENPLIRAVVCSIFKIETKQKYDLTILYTAKPGPKNVDGETCAMNPPSPPLGTSSAQLAVITSLHQGPVAS